jgi:hypothetical protein
MRQIAELVALLACGLFTGAAWYISLVEHPARMECGVELAATQFSPSYRRARIMQASLAVVCLLSSVAAWLAGATFWWAVAGILLGSVISFTLIVIMPTNKQVKPDARQPFSTDRSTTRTLGNFTWRKKCPQWNGLIAVPLPLNFYQSDVTGRGAEGRSCPSVLNLRRLIPNLNILSEMF